MKRLLNIRCIFLNLIIITIFFSCQKNLKNNEQIVQEDLTIAATNSISKIKLVDSSYIIVFNDHVKEIENETARLATENSTKANFIYKSAIKGFAAKLTPEKAEKLKKHPKIKSVTQELVGEFDYIQYNPQNWGLDRVDQRNLPLNNNYEYHDKAGSVNVYIFDSGVKLDHASFGGRAILGIDPTPDANGIDYYGHGTHVAGIVGSSLFGVAKNVRLISAKVGRDRPSESYAIACIEWAIQHHTDGQDAVGNMSWTIGPSQNLDNAVQNAINDGIIMISAAGNSNTVTGSSSPQRLASVITVGASNKYDQRWYQSNYGPLVDLFAPGENIISCGISSVNDFIPMSGTSMAAPHVTGTVALYLSVRYGPTNQTQVEAWLKDSATKNVLQNIPYGTANRLLYSYIPDTYCSAIAADGFTLSFSSVSVDFEDWNEATIWVGFAPQSTIYPNTTYTVAYLECGKPTAIRTENCSSPGGLNFTTTVYPSGRVDVVFPGPPSITPIPGQVAVIHMNYPI